MPKKPYFFSKAYFWKKRQTRSIIGFLERVGAPYEEVEDGLFYVHICPSGHLNVEGVYIDVCYGGVWCYSPAVDAPVDESAQFQLYVIIDMINALLENCDIYYDPIKNILYAEQYIRSETIENDDDIFSMVHDVLFAYENFGKAIGETLTRQRYPDDAMRRAILRPMNGSFLSSFPTYDIAVGAPVLSGHEKERLRRRFRRKKRAPRTGTSNERMDMLVRDENNLISCVLTYDFNRYRAPKVLSIEILRDAVRLTNRFLKSDDHVAVNSPLASALLENCVIGAEIPSILYESVAKELARLYYSPKKA